ncbi:BQ5605_C048g12366 [Microbotryum silenes-dioicae]|uniref:BQ5605_C048g12366 protein n=1 Tax=Microbotryum silenes-dioicae TaxID=796604 RepID=A0A2X0NH52_9BASI|nr:BQ5605_C048g12366 [Microbotryum silenes-dioicae]
MSFRQATPLSFGPGTFGRARALSKLWPHHDPFGLVGFCVERDLKISLDELIKHLLNLYDSDFDATPTPPPPPRNGTIPRSGPDLKSRIRFGMHFKSLRRFQIGGPISGSSHFRRGDKRVACRVFKEKVARIAAALLENDMDVVSEMIKKSKDTKRYKATTEAEKHINRILAELQSVGDKIHGTTAQMLDMRNEIRGYVNAFSMYTLFVTVNLADLHSPLR